MSSVNIRMMDDSEGWYLISSQSGFLQLQSDWEQLFRRNSRHSPFLAWGWVNAWLAFLAGPHELLIACHRDIAGELDFVLPLIRRARGRRIGKPGVVFACSFGPECSEKLGWLCSPALDDVSATMVAEAVSRFLNSRDFIALAPLDDAGNLPEKLRSAVRSRGRTTSIGPDVVCPTLELPDSWESYLQQLSSNFRSQVRRSERNFNGSGELRIRVLEAANAKEFAHKLIGLNQSRMRVKGQISSMEDEAFQAFLLDAIPYMASQDIAWMDVVESGSEIVGVALNFVHGSGIYYYSGGFEDRFSKSRPGTALFAAAIRRGIESEYKSFNFLRGDEPYKYRWGARDVIDRRAIIFPSAQVHRQIAVTAESLYAFASRLREASSKIRSRMR